MIKKLILFIMTSNMSVGSALIAAGYITNENFNQMINETTIQQENTAHILWNYERTRDYLRKKRTLQTTRMMLAAESEGSEK